MGENRDWKIFERAEAIYFRFGESFPAVFRKNRRTRGPEVINRNMVHPSIHGYSVDQGGVGDNGARPLEKYPRWRTIRSRIVFEATRFFLVRFSLDCRELLCNIDEVFVVAFSRAKCVKIVCWNRNDSCRIFFCHDCNNVSVRASNFV